MQFQLFVVAVLLLMFYEDLKFRCIRIVLFPVLAASLIYLRTRDSSFVDLCDDAVINVIYIFTLMSTSFAYLFIKYRKNRFAEFLGVGDVLLLFCLATWFEPVSFIFFNMISFFLSLVFHVVLRKCARNYAVNETVPLAGYQSLCFALFLLIHST